MAVHTAIGTTKNFLRLVTLIALGQYLLCYPMNSIEKLKKLEEYKIEDHNITVEKEKMLEIFKCFQLANLDGFVKELYHSLNLLYLSKEHKNAYRLKLQEIMIISAGARQPLFNCFFNTVTAIS